MKVMSASYQKSESQVKKKEERRRSPDICIAT